MTYDFGREHQDPLHQQAGDLTERIRLYKWLKKQSGRGFILGALAEEFWHSPMENFWRAVGKLERRLGSEGKLKRRRNE
jgi:hypothetical protein